MFTQSGSLACRVPLHFSFVLVKTRPCKIAHFPEKTKDLRGELGRAVRGGLGSLAATTGTRGHRELKHTLSGGSSAR